MALKSYNPTTPSQRHLVIVDRSFLHKGPPLKSLTEGQTSTGGRNNRGRITVRFRGGGHKQAYRKIDFKRAKRDIPATVERLEYDPNRTGFIALIKYADGERSYILAPQRLAPGDTVIAGEHVDVKPGNAMPLGNMPLGTIVHNIELKIGKGGQVARSAGAYAQIVGRDRDYVILRLNSAEQRLVHGRCMATVGAVSNPDNMNTTIGKAGRQRWRGRRPHNRGISMNPVDHPHGGRTNGGKHWVTPWGFPTKGKKTRKKSARPSSSSSAGTSATSRAEDRHHGAIGVEGSVCRRLFAAQGGSRARFRPPRGDQDLEPAFDHPAAIRRTDVRRLQRAETYPGAGDGGNGRPQIRRVRADPGVLRPCLRPQGQARGGPGRGGSRIHQWCSGGARRAGGQVGCRETSWASLDANAIFRIRRPRRSRGCCACRRASSISWRSSSAARRSPPRSPTCNSRASASPRTCASVWNRRSPMPRTTTTSTSTSSSSPRLMSARRWCSSALPRAVAAASGASLNRFPT